MEKSKKLSTDMTERLGPWKNLALSALIATGLPACNSGPVYVAPTPLGIPVVTPYAEQLGECDLPNLGFEVIWERWTGPRREFKLKDGPLFVVTINGIDVTIVKRKDNQNIIHGGGRLPLGEVAWAFLYDAEIASETTIIFYACSENDVRYGVFENDPRALELEK